jgi:hypothetical protein
MCCDVLSCGVLCCRVLCCVVVCCAVMCCRVLCCAILANKLTGVEAVCQALKLSCLCHLLFVNSFFYSLFGCLMFVFLLIYYYYLRGMRLQKRGEQIRKSRVLYLKYFTYIHVSLLVHNIVLFLSVLINIITIPSFNIYIYPTNIIQINTLCSMYCVRASEVNAPRFSMCVHVCSFIIIAIMEEERS